MGYLYCFGPSVRCRPLHIVDLPTNLRKIYNNVSRMKQNLSGFAVENMNKGQRFEVLLTR
jgi:hypothetical protein